ncbi:hypothetical protein [Pseudomonas fluorescens]|uniref:Lipoprotein n=1 Tax=Pseudomonas fluorescens TaxID=294 RepID=A0A5E7BED5_PSEFL|nr:hypothetical protein [Pseudomonas fluorescens]VVN90226.1 hypothetical protein PS691_01806 [Pseudomonas fluorescens]
MNSLLRAAGFSLFVLFASCGVGAQTQAQSLATPPDPLASCAR